MYHLLGVVQALEGRQFIARGGNPWNKNKAAVLVEPWKGDSALPPFQG